MRLLLLVALALLLHGVVAAPSPSPRESFPLRPALGDLVNLERYPIGDLASAEGRALVEKARRDLAATGCASFPCFLAPAALADAVEEATAAAPGAFETDDTHNAYQLSDTDATLLATHVRNQQMRTRVASTACDELDESRAIRALYACDELLGLVHSPHYLQRLKTLRRADGARLEAEAEQFDDVFLNEHSIACARLAVDGVVRMAEALWAGSMHNGLALVRPGRCRGDVGEM